MALKSSREESAAEDRNTRKEACSREDWRGKLRQDHRRRDLHHLQRLHHDHHDQGGVVHLWTMGLWQWLDLFLSCSS
jgi:hypothetical protein